MRTHAAILTSMKQWCAVNLAQALSREAPLYRPEGAAHEQQPWLASVWRRLAHSEPGKRVRDSREGRSAASLKGSDREGRQTTIQHPMSAN